MSGNRVVEVASSQSCDGEPNRTGVCAEGLRLMQIYLANISSYSSTLEALDLGCSNTTRAEYKLRTDYAEQCWQLFEDARGEFERHLEEHKCGLIAIDSQKQQCTASG
jgi:hypothetical protein